MDEYREEKKPRVRNLHIIKGEIIITYEDGEVITIYTDVKYDDNNNRLETYPTSIEGVRVPIDKSGEILLKLNRLF